MGGIVNLQRAGWFGGRKQRTMISPARNYRSSSKTILRPEILGRLRRSDLFQAVGPLSAPFGAKVNPHVLDRLADLPQGLEVLVTAMTPRYKAGIGKTTTSIALAMGLNRLLRQQGKIRGREIGAIAALRDPSVGPSMGYKSGGLGDGRACVYPMHETNIGQTGYEDAIIAAHEIISTRIGALLSNGSLIADEVRNWHPVTSLGNLLLRSLEAKLTVKKPQRAGISEGEIRLPWGYHIAAASELQAIIGLSRNLQEVRERVSRMVVGEAQDGHYITVDDLGITGAVMAKLATTYAFYPNLRLANPETPVFLHTGPFGNIAHGCSSIIADRIARKLAQVTVTEAGFGSDLGAQKYFDIKKFYSGDFPNVAVLVTSVRGLKVHNARYAVLQGDALTEALKARDIDAMETGLANLAWHIRHLRENYGVPVVVAINRYAGDHPKEVEEIYLRAMQLNAEGVAAHNGFARGAGGSLELAKAVLGAANTSLQPRFLHRPEAGIRANLGRLATNLGAADVTYSDVAEAQLQRLERNPSTDRLPICLAKQQYSFSDDPNATGVPTGFTLPVNEFHLRAGAGFVTPVVGNIPLLPGIGPQKSLLTHFDVDGQERVIITD